ncbi:MAG: hypothetical protein Tp138OMZ00d2C19078221_13 [Prokaryotic dsDNA virus sp.]|jgi:hypothetical protein|nr:hypothetical protein [Pseudomonadales bacterium]QDP67441.1 MAG: hypothetical protein Tp138OMZ00d2C19078221_13 [Prokaryotic dsDNA virus sp.]|tara:strand:+ start:38434 stop:38622 length:189 start_codon:yes stop_codon:yes gene_type:complete
MSQDDFILNNVKAELMKARISERIAGLAAQDALHYYRQCSHFKKSAWADTMAYAKKRAKAIK